MAKQHRPVVTTQSPSRQMWRRSVIIMVILVGFCFSAVIGKLAVLQLVETADWQERAVTQQLSDSVVTSKRGTIYDANMKTLAASAEVWKLIMAPKNIQDLDTNRDMRTFIADQLAEMLGVNREKLYKQTGKTYSQYEVVKSKMEFELKEKVAQWILDNKLIGVFSIIPDYKRYYPLQNTLSNVLGFTGTDNTGLEGLEAAYNADLMGKAGRIVTAKNGWGDELPTDMEYAKIVDAEDGNSLVLTIDANIQTFAEKYLEIAVRETGCTNRGAVIIQDVNTGGILAMASYPNYDLNDFSAVQDQTLQERIARGENTLAEMQLLQWRNKALNDTYEPGSTFKILTLAAALEEGVINKNTTVNCSGFVTISGQTIHCSNKAGHGLQTLVQTVGNSCNPAFISYGLKLGNTAFYEYMRSFGLMEGTGIDLGGEADSIFADPASFTQLDLACYAFGQNFNVTPIALITAQAACVNGGYLRTPYLVERITDSNGSVTYQHDSTPIRQVVSEETSATVRECLEYVVASGTGKNGQVAGYRVGGKTGTADKGQTGDVVVSFLCFAPADDPQVIMLLTLDTHSRSTGTYVSGGNMVAPTASSIMSEVLPYLGVEPSYSAEELLGMDTTVPNVIGMSVEEAKTRLGERGLSYKIDGDGDTVTDQTPAGGAIIPGKSAVILYAGTDKSTAKCTVPHLIGKTPSEANTAATGAGLFIRFSGTTGSESSAVRVLSQSIEAGAEVEAGTVITVQLGDTSVTD